MKYNIISELISLHIVALTSYSDTTHVNFQERVILLVINHGLAAAPLRNPWTDWDGAPEFHQVPFCAVAPSIIVRQPRHCDEIANASPSYIRPSQQGLALFIFPCCVYTIFHPSKTNYSKDHSHHNVWSIQQPIQSIRCPAARPWPAQRWILRRPT